MKYIYYEGEKSTVIKGTKKKQQHVTKHVTVYIGDNGISLEVDLHTVSHTGRVRLTWGQCGIFSSNAFIKQGIAGISRSSSQTG